MQIRKALSPSEKTETTAARAVENENEENEDDKILNEMEELTHAMDRKQKRKKKLIAKRRAKVWCLYMYKSLSLSCMNTTYTESGNGNICVYHFQLRDP